MNLADELDELGQKIDASEGVRIELRLRNLRSSYYIFAVNASNFLRAMERFEDPDQAAERWREDRREALHALQDEILRQFHNFLASVKTLVDHTRILVEDLYEEHDFGPEYEERKNSTFVDSPICAFVQGMRNYFLHKSIPPHSAKLEFKRGQPLDTSMYLHIPSLRYWDGWSPVARRFLDASPDDIRFRDIVSQYRDLTEEFYQWFTQRQLEVHAGALSEVHAYRSRMSTIYDAVTGRR